MRPSATAEGLLQSFLLQCTAYMASFDEVLSRYEYTYPPSLIAQGPVSPRDSARLLVYNRVTDEVCYDTYFNLPKYLPRNAVIVFNQTKVIPARIVLRKKTGGRIRMLIIEKGNGVIKVMSDPKLVVGSTLSLTKMLTFYVERAEERYFYLRPSFPLKELDSVLSAHGTTPIPPYIKHTPLTEAQLRVRYQTIFARYPGSIAAPTASLHFTKRLIKKIEAAGAAVKFVTLHVNLGTFIPLTPKHIATGKLHEEWYEIDPATVRFLNKAKKEGRPIIAVGTTVVRTLESAADGTGILVNPCGATDLFIKEKYNFSFVDHLITNFHVPRSSLLMLVASFCGREKLLEIYKQVVAQKFRLFSFGDGMLIL